MSDASTYDLVRECLELREQLAYGKRRLAFLLGAGTSMAVGLPGIQSLTDQVEHELKDQQLEQYKAVRSSLRGKPTVEDVLNKIRLYRELLEDDTGGKIANLSSDDAKKLDTTIGATIAGIVGKEPSKGLGPYVTFAQWLRELSRKYSQSVEIFTLNYDLLLEQSMEQVGAPFFDGFVGSVLPFFVPESVEAEESEGAVSDKAPRSWLRLWKLHGSVSWHLVQSTSSKQGRICRFTGPPRQPEDQLMVFPSREKYIDSRRLPFLTFQDRFRKLLSSGETLLLIIGYSFSDQHINEILFQSLRSNPRLAAMTLIFGVDDEKAKKRIIPKEIVQYGQQFRNLTLYGPDSACIGGLHKNWTPLGESEHAAEIAELWDSKSGMFLLGDFNLFSVFLEKHLGLGGSRMQPPAGGTTLPAAGEAPSK